MARPEADMSDQWGLPSESSCLLGCLAMAGILIAIGMLIGHFFLR